MGTPSEVSAALPTRRQVLRGGLAAAGVLASARLSAFAQAPVSPVAGSVVVSATAGKHIAADYTGLSYETTQLAHPQFFSGDSAALARYFRLLGHDGVLRIGGNMSEFSFWDPKAPVTETPDGVEGPDPGHGSPRTYKIPAVAIDNLAKFLKLTGWKLIYGLNLAAGTPETAADEAEYVAKAIGTNLVALQFGNEPDLFKHNKDPKQHWTYDEFITKWQLFYDAVHPRVPHVMIAGPDTSYEPVWMKKFCEQEKGKIGLLTGHYYAGGPPTDPKMTTGFLLEPNARLKDHVLRAIEIGNANGVPYRMSEGNTCYGAGKKGVSDTFASALWAVDFWLQLAEQGSTGVNLHGGGNGYYTPIAGSPAKGLVARPIFYGLQMAGAFAGAQLHACEVNAGGKNVVAYAGTKAKGAALAIVNRDAVPVRLEVDLPASLEGASAAEFSGWRLQAPSLESTSGVTFAGAEVTTDGHWMPKKTEKIAVRKGKAVVELAPYSAILLCTAGF